MDDADFQNILLLSQQPELGEVVPGEPTGSG